MKKFEVNHMANIKTGRSLKLELDAELIEDNISSLEKVFKTDTEQNNELEEQMIGLEQGLMTRLRTEAVKTWTDIAYKLQQLELAKQYRSLTTMNDQMITTGNRWITADNEAYISNYLYMLKTSLQADSVSGYKVDWSLTIRRINPEATGIDMVGIDGQHGKKFTTKGEAVKYIEGRYNKYRELFTIDVPEVPAEYADGLKYMGVLLPCYKVASQKSGN